MGHRPFLVLADALTRRGIAVLRYDDRGVGKSTGSFSGATTFDFAEDALAGLRFLQKQKDIDPKKIGICGHSEGGLIAPICAVKSKEVAFVVLLAGPAVSGAEILKWQAPRLLKARGFPQPLIDEALSFNEKVFSCIQEGKALEETRRKLRSVLEEAWKARPQGKKESFVKAQLKRFLSPWFRTFLRFDPKSTISKLSCPVLVLNGEKDLQVVPEQNLPVFRKLLAGHPDASMVEFKGLNHLFQTCKTGAPSEYGQIEETMAPKVLKRVGDWLVKRFVKPSPKRGDSKESGK